jgi:hypothetical protein
LHITIDDSDDDDNDKSYIPPASKTTAAPIPAAAPTPEAIIILSDDEDNQAGQAQKDGSTAVEEDFPDSSDDEGPNPVLTVFIVPRIPNTKPLLVKRKYNQVLKDVRLAWCKHNNLTPAETATIIFTWRDRRVFDIQSCKSLGIKIDEDGIPYILTDDIRAELENVALIATTRNIMEEEKRDEKKRTELIPDEPSEQPSQTATSEPTGEQQYKVVLRSKSYPDQKLILKEVCALPIFTTLLYMYTNSLLRIRPCTKLQLFSVARTKSKQTRRFGSCTMGTLFLPSCKSKMRNSLTTMRVISFASKFTLHESMIY